MRYIDLLPKNYDIVSETTATGQHITVLTVIDEVTRECLALEADTSIIGTRVDAVLNKIAFSGDILPKY